MPKNVCFCVYDCAGKDIANTDSKYTKSIKNEHETGKVKQGQARDSKVKVLLRKSTLVLLLCKFVTNGPWIIFEKMAEMVPVLSVCTLLALIKVY